MSTTQTKASSTQSTTQASQPRTSVQPESLGIRKEFRQIEESLTKQFYFRDVRPTDDKKRMIAVFTQDIGTLTTFHAAAVQLIRNAVGANVMVETDEHNANREAELRRAGVKELSQHVPASTLHIDDVFNWDTAALPNDVFWRTLGLCLCDTVQRVARGVQDTLDEMVDRNLFGLYETHPKAEHIARCHFFRVVVRQHRVGTMPNETRTVHRDGVSVWREVETTISTHHQRRTLLYERHEHHSYETAFHSWPASRVPQPLYIRQFLQKVPICWRPFIRVASGEMLKDEIKSHVKYKRDFEEADVVERVVRRGVMVDPAILIGDVVLTGWSDADLAQQRPLVGRLMNRVLRVRR